MSGFSKPGAHGMPQFTRTSLLGLSKHDLERDSGFSDASSEYLSAVEVTDSEDTGRNGSIFRQEAAGQQVAVVGGSYTGLSPMIIMNNFVLKQVDLCQDSCYRAFSDFCSSCCDQTGGPSNMVPQEKQWGFPSPVEMIPQSQVVLLQPMVSNGNSSTSKTGSDNKRQSKAALKSYPKIAPYPVDTPTKRVGSSKGRASETLGYEQRRHHQRLNDSASPLLAQAQTIINSEAGTNKTEAGESQEQLPDESLTLQEQAPPTYTEDFRTVTENNEMLADEYQDPISMHTNKLKRFSNTYNILSKSGLLGITMRTKQLIKENKRTQGQLHQLQEQTALLLEALSSGDPQLWTKLQLSLQDTEKEHQGTKAQRVEA